MRVDSVGFKINKSVVCKEEVVFSLVSVLRKSMGQVGTWGGEASARFRTMEEVDGV